MNDMNDYVDDTLSPKEVAVAVGVSESSIKRWVDAGLIPVLRTAGGHRRIRRIDAIHFVREKGLRIARPDQFRPRDDAVVDPGRTLDGVYLSRLLAQGEVVEAANLINAAYLSGLALPALFDGPVTESMALIGEAWLEGKRGIFVEHRATAAVVDIIAQLGTIQPQPSPDKPIALGGSPPNDPHIIPSQMAAAVFREHRWRTTNLGPRTPLYTFLDATEEEQPAVVWLALKTSMNREQASGLVQLCERLIEMEVLPVLGGTEAIAKARYWPGGTVLAKSMAELDCVIAETSM